MEELEEFEYKVKNVLSARELPEELKLLIDELYTEYVDFFRENVENVVNRDSKRMPTVEEFFENDHKDTLEKIEEMYEEDCSEKVYEVIDEVRRIEENSENQLSKEEKEIRIEDLFSDNSQNYGKVNKISDIVLDSVVESGNNVFRTLENRNIHIEDMEYLTNTKRLIENKIKLKICEEGKVDLDRDDDEIAKLVIEEYEDYLEKVQVQGREQEEKTAHQKFVDEYAVPEDQLVKEEKEESEKVEEELKKKANETDIFMRN